MKININNLTKSELKDYVHKNGYFSQSTMNRLDRESVENSLTSAGVENAVQITNNIPQGDNIFIYSGIISQRYGKGEKNRNGYKISPDGWRIDEYMFNPAILLMHDPERGVIGNMVSLRVTTEGLNAMFRVDVNNISDSGIRNQIMTGTLKATSTGSMIDGYQFEEENGKSISEAEAEEKYGEWEVFLAYIGASDRLILNITQSVLLEVSMVTLGSNYKAVNNDTIGNYFNTLLSNKMTPEQLEEMKAKANAVDTTEKEAETPQGTTDADTTTTAVSENDTTTEATATENEAETTETTTSEEETTEETEKVATTEEPQATEEDKTETDTALQDALNLVNELKAKVEALENEINTPVTNNQLAKGASANTVAIDPKKAQMDFFTKVWETKT